MLNTTFPHSNTDVIQHAARVLNGRLLGTSWCCWYGFGYHCCLEASQQFRTLATPLMKVSYACVHLKAPSHLKAILATHVGSKYCLGDFYLLLLKCFGTKSRHRSKSKSTAEVNKFSIKVYAFTLSLSRTIVIVFKHSF